MSATMLTRTAIISADPHEQAVRRSLSMRTGYALDNYRETHLASTGSTCDAIAWSATLTLDGARIGFVAHDGSDSTAGAEVRLDDTTHRASLYAEATSRYPGHPTSALEAFVTDLSLRAIFNRMRGVLFIHDGIEVAAGLYLRFPAKISPAEACARLTHPSSRYRTLNPRVWDSATSIFAAPSLTVGDLL